jgi:hypothetical protein
MVHAFFAIAATERGLGGRFSTGWRSFSGIGGNARNEAAVRTVVELNCGLKSI